MNSERHQAEVIAEQDAKTDVNKIVWLVAGLAANIIGLLFAYIYQPEPPASRLFEKSEEYRMFHTDAYKAKAQSIQVTLAFIGLLIHIIGLIIFHLVISKVISNMIAR